MSLMVLKKLGMEMPERSCLVGLVVLLAIMKWVCFCGLEYAILILSATVGHMRDLLGCLGIRVWFFMRNMQVFSVIVEIFSVLVFNEITSKCVYNKSWVTLNDWMVIAILGNDLQMRLHFVIQLFLVNVVLSPWYEYSFAIMVTCIWQSLGCFSQLKWQFCWYGHFWWQNLHVMNTCHVMQD